MTLIFLSFILSCSNFSSLPFCSYNFRNKHLFITTFVEIIFISKRNIIFLHLVCFFALFKLLSFMQISFQPCEFLIQAMSSIHPPAQKKNRTMNLFQALINTFEFLNNVELSDILVDKKWLKMKLYFKNPQKFKWNCTILSLTSHTLLSLYYIVKKEIN